MSGHSKYSNIKHKKALNDKAKAKTFHTYLKQIESILKETNNPNLESNFRLKQAVTKAIQANVSKKNILNLINNFSKKSHETDDNAIFLFKGSGGKFIIVSGYFENKNRILYELKSTLLKVGFLLLSDNNWTIIFEVIDLIKILKSEIDFSKFFRVLAEVSLDNYQETENFYQLLVPINKGKAVIDKLKEENIIFEHKNHIFWAKNYLSVKLSLEEKENLLKAKNKVLSFLGVRTFATNFFS